MYTLVLPNRFRRNLRKFLKKHPDLKTTIRKTLIRLKNNPRDPRLRIHKLSGALRGRLGAWVTYEYRIAFSVEDEKIYLLAIGTHDEVY